MEFNRNKLRKLSTTPVKRFFQLVSLEREDISLIYLYAILSGVINLSFPLGIQAIMSIVLGGRPSPSWYLLMGLVISGIIFGGIMQVMQMTISERLQQRIMSRASFDFAFRIPRWKLESILKMYTPELLNRFFDVVSVQKSLSKIMVEFSTAFLQILFGLILLSFYHPFFGIFAVISFSVMLLFFYFSFSAGLSTSLLESKYKYKVAAWLQELARSLNIFKLAGYTDMHLRKTDRLVVDYLRGRKAHFRILLFQYGVIVAFKAIITGGVLIIGSILIFDNEISLGQFVASEIVIILILNSIEKLMKNIEVVYDVLTSLEKIGHVVDIDIEGEEGVSYEEIRLDGKGVEIVFKDVAYKFPEDEHPKLQGVNLHIRSGEKVCIAGYSASGRSTLINLAASMLHDYTGLVTFNDISLKNINLISLRSHVGENLSNTEILHGTIEENISMGRDDINFETIKSATDAVNLTEYIQQTPEGYHTIVVPDDVTISKSIMNKITLARSIAEQPDLFILDDFLTSLEYNDKTKVVDALTGKDKAWTLVGSSNDKAFAKRCDKVVIMKEGKIVDVGSYEKISHRDDFDLIFR
ncbi:MAG: ABC transporter ATP-binding protein [Cytophagales bacterium]|nr:ABC transporter ATP-binding protein [Cytophagales bacterium]